MNDYIPKNIIYLPNIIDFESATSLDSKEVSEKEEAKINFRGMENH